MKARRGSTIVAVDGKKSGFLKVLVVKTLGGKKVSHIFLPLRCTPRHRIAYFIRTADVSM